MGKKCIEKYYNKNFNQQIIMNFWMTWFGPYLQKFLLVIFLLDQDFFFPLKCMSKSCLDGQPFLWILLID
jgi:hypothetical protein